MTDPPVGESHTHTHGGDRENKSKGTSKAVGANSSGAAKQL